MKKINIHPSEHKLMFVRYYIRLLKDHGEWTIIQNICFHCVSNKLDMEPDNEKGWNIIKEAVNKATSLEKPWFNDECRDVTEKRILLNLIVASAFKYQPQRTYNFHYSEPLFSLIFSFIVRKILLFEICERAKLIGCKIRTVDPNRLVSFIWEFLKSFFAVIEGSHVRQPLQGPSQYLVLDTTHVYAHSTVEDLPLHYHKWLGRQRRQRSAVQPPVQLLRLRRRGRWWLLSDREPDLLLTVRLCGGRSRPPHRRTDWWQPRAAAAVVFESGARITLRDHQPDTRPSVVNLFPPIRLHKNKIRRVTMMSADGRAGLNSC
ncbi:hypothetical protein QTP88_005899 [Uroleucon formosanum]